MEKHNCELFIIWDKYIVHSTLLELKLSHEIFEIVSLLSHENFEVVSRKYRNCLTKILKLSQMHSMRRLVTIKTMCDVQMGDHMFISYGSHCLADF